MSTSHPYQTSNPTVDEQRRWIIHIRRSLDEDLEQETDIHVSIFDVPRTLLLSSPESYVPQKIALGPYHHSRPELYEMERYKLAAARRFQRHTPGLKFQDLVDRLVSLEPRFRSCYQKYLHFNGETIAWMMAIDSCFLLEFLWIFASKEEGIMHASTSPSVDITGRKSGCDAIIRDVLMLENQVPLFSLRMVIEFQSASVEQADAMLCLILIRFCKEVSPFKTTVIERADSGHIAKSAHLLDLVYRSIVLESEGSPQMEAEIEDATEEGEKMRFGNVIAKVGPGPVNFIRRLVDSRPVKFILTLPWKIISNLPGMIMLRQMEQLYFSQENASENNDQNYESGDNVNKHPLMEEISIPCVTELSEAGIRYAVTNSIRGIEFDQKTATLYLPTVCLDVNTEVVLRNLVAYEACNASGPLIFTRYVELMNGIIDGEDDAKVLRENGIVLNHLKCDMDVADLWNGMSRSVRLTKVPFLDRVIEDVNDYYRGKWKVRIRKFLKRRVFGSWRCLTLLGAFWVLFFMSLQSFCSVFGCASRMLHHRRGMS